jgi:hypothetical protein
MFFLKKKRFFKKYFPFLFFFERLRLFPPLCQPSGNGEGRGKKNIKKVKPVGRQNAMLAFLRLFVTSILYSFHSIL